LAPSAINETIRIKIYLVIEFKFVQKYKNISTLKNGIYINE
jgi:hypothetical protein